MKFFIEKLQNLLQNNTETLIQITSLVDFKRNLEQDIRENSIKLERIQNEINELNKQNLEQKNKVLEEQKLTIKQQLYATKKDNTNLENSYKLKKKQTQETIKIDIQTLRANAQKAEENKQEINEKNAKFDNNLMIQIDFESQLVGIENDDIYKKEEKQFLQNVEELEREYAQRKKDLKNLEIKYEQEIEQLKQSQNSEIKQIFTEKMMKQQEKNEIENSMHKSNEMIELEIQIAAFDDELNRKQKELENKRQFLQKIKEDTKYNYIALNKLKETIQEKTNKN